MAEQGLPEGVSVDHALGLYLADCAGRSFSWRAWNCAHFCAGWVQRVTGRAIDWPARDQPRLRRSFAQAVAQRSGLPAIPVADARLGDVLLTSEGALGICAGPVIAVLPGGPGIAFVPRGLATHAWRVA